MKTLVGAYCIRPIFAAILLLICTAAFAQQKVKTTVSAALFFTDPRDRVQYRVVDIGEQTWMADNLYYAAEGSRCYKDSTAYCDKYGRLYNWQTAMTACPSGWHLPSSKEWEVLATTAGGEWTGGKNLKAVSGWKSFDGKSFNGTDIYGFSALPSGYYNSVVSKFFDVGSYGYWWKSSEKDSKNVYNSVMDNKGDYIVLLDFGGKNDLRSVRCIKDLDNPSKQISLNPQENPQ
jgi:uncharacterized protein (TIGR02145 family)